MRDLHCALKHILISDFGFIELKQKIQRFYTLTKNEKYIEILKELNEQHKELIKVKEILRNIFFKNEKLNDKDVVVVLDCIRVIRNKLELTTKKLLEIGIDIEDKELYENGYLEDYDVVYSNLAHAEVHLNKDIGENDDNRNE